MRNYAHVDPQLLIAARERLRMSEEVAARKLGTSLARFKEWEAGKASPTVRQLRLAAHIYRQSLAFFFLPGVPDDYAPALEDFRRLPTEQDSVLSSAIAREIHDCSIRRDIAIELLQLRADSDAPLAFGFRATLGDTPEDVGTRLRDYLRMGLAAQFGWHDARVAFNGWRHAAESNGILVFQAADVEVDDMRGFSIARFPLPAIVVNRKDACVGRIFSLLHEAIHLGLRSSALCDMVEYRHGHSNAVEVFCNHAAGAALVPSRALLQQECVRRAQATSTLSDWDVEQLARQFSVSREVIVRRLLILEVVSRAFYEQKRREYSERVPPKPDRKGYPSPSTDSLSKNGDLLARLILDSMRDNLITPNDASDYLGVRMKHFEKIEERIGMR